jgi:hypothetical protein
MISLRTKNQPKRKGVDHEILGLFFCKPKAKKRKEIRDGRGVARASKNICLLDNLFGANVN